MATTRNSDPPPQTPASGADSDAGGVASAAPQPPEPPTPAVQPPPTLGPNNKGESATAAEEAKNRPTCSLVVGMAGSGKTTLMQRLNHYAIELQQRKRIEKAAAAVAAATESSATAAAATAPAAGGEEEEEEEVEEPVYYVNMDPAVTQVPFAAGIDIRDTVDYKQVMKQYKLGPNGGIMTSLNLFATRFDQVLDILERRAAGGHLKHVFFDTPGQIEVFTWSASGMIITETLALQFPTVLLFVVDLSRSTNPTTWMSNMLYACSMLYKTNLPVVLVLNKADVTDPAFALEWMRDLDAFQEALDSGDRDQSYMTSLNRSMGLLLDEFYANLRAVPVSAATGEGLPELWAAIDAAAAEYTVNYLPELRRRKAAKRAQEAARQAAAMEKLMTDMRVDGGEEGREGSDGGGGRGGGRGGSKGGSATAPAENSSTGVSR